MGDGERSSKPLEVDFITDPDEKAEREAKNGLRQFDLVIEMIDHWLETGRDFKLRPSAILSLHRTALDGISRYAGNYRPAGIEIQGSDHTPIGAHLVPGEVEGLCDHVNENWDHSAIRLSAYGMWRLNWIHPFTDGNGRTSRAISYLLLCVKVGYRLPGTKTIPAQISNNKEPYYQALEAADKVWIDGELDMTQLEDLLEGLLATQLASVLEAAKGI